MSPTDPDLPPDAPGVSRADQVRVDLEETRKELAQTVDALSEKLNVKARAGDKVSEAKQKVAVTATRAKQSAPPPVQHALDVAGEKAKPVMAQVSQKAAPHRTEILAGAAAVALLALVARRRRNRSDDAE